MVGLCAGSLRVQASIRSLTARGHCSGTLHISCHVSCPECRKVLAVIDLCVGSLRVQASTRLLTAQGTAQAPCAQADK